MDIFADLQEILSTNEGFLLGKWIEAARKVGYNEEVRELHIYFT